jgi:hypothetical protein
MVGSTGKAYRVHLAWEPTYSDSASNAQVWLSLSVTSSTGSLSVYVTGGAYPAFSSSVTQFKINGFAQINSATALPVGSTIGSSVSPTALPALSNRSTLPWSTISLHFQTSTQDGASYLADGEVEIRHNGMPIGHLTGLTINVDEATARVQTRFTLLPADSDDLWVSPDYGGTTRTLVETFDDLARGAYASPSLGLGTPWTSYNWSARPAGWSSALAAYINTDGGASGPAYASLNPNPVVLPVEPGTPGFVSPARAGLVPGSTAAGCAPGTGTGPNMIGGAVRCILVDTGVTSTITVDTPAPPPGETTQDLSIPQANGFANEQTGSGSINVPTWFFIAPLMSDGRVGPLSNIMDLDQGFDPNYPPHNAVVSWNDTSPAPDQWIVWMFTDSNFHPISNPEPGARVRIIPGSPHMTPTWPPGNTYDFQVIFTSTDDGDPWETFPPVGEGTGGTTTSSAFSGYRYVIAGHTLRRVLQVYVRQPVALPPTTAGGDSITVDAQILQHEGTDYVQEVIEVNGNRYHTLRFFRAMQSDDCTQQYEVTANVEGAETNADGSGVLITFGVAMVEHILLNWVFNDYRSSTGIYAPAGGRWFDDVPYAPGLVDHASFTTAQQASFAFVSGGYKGAGMMIEQKTGHEVVSDLMRSFGLDFFFEPLAAGGNGAWWAKLFNPDLVSRGTLKEIRPDPPSEIGYIGTLSFSMHFDRAGQHTVVPYLAGPMFGMLASEGVNTDGGYTASGEVRDPEAIQAYGTKVSEPLILPWTREPLTAYSVAFRFLRMARYPPIYATVRTPLSALILPLASEVLVTHPDGTGFTGWSQRVCRIYRMETDLDKLETTLLLRDVDALVP